jgi:two-component system, NtrC family, response regulator AtoC
VAVATVSQARGREGDGGDTVARLHVVAVGPGFTTTLALPAAGTLLVGRDEAADVRIVDPAASRHHARLHVGVTLQIEDLGSANGTRLRGQPLAAGAPVTLAPGEVVGIGETILFVERREPAAVRGLRWLPHGYFETRLIEECARAEVARGELTLLRLSVAAGTPRARLEAAALPALRPGDVLGEYGPDQYEILLPDSRRDACQAIAAALAGALAAAGLDAHLGAACFPGDGTSPGALFGHAGAALRGGAAAGGAGAGAATLLVTNPAMRDLYALADRVAASAINVLVIGETGSGKELLAETLHRRSPRASHPFVCINCAALSESLLESELFGHERGAFTGAVGARVGLLETAGQGTVFLDEIGELPLALQAKLLRALESRQIMRVGGTTHRRIEARFVAATNRDLEDEVAQRTFRQDLYFRLNGITLAIPPLRERADEIEPLGRLFLEAAARAAGRTPPALTAEALALLQAYPWPGNIRELRNVMERALLFASGSVIAPEHLPLSKLQPRAPEAAPPAEVATGAPPLPAGVGLRERQIELEKQAIVDALQRCAGNQTRAAELLGMPRRTFCNRLKEYGILRPRR